MAKVLVPLADGCEELEAVTIIDLLRRAGIEVVSAGLKPGVVKASRGVQLVPDVTLDVALQDDYDMVVLPGGMPGAAHLKDDVRILDLLKNMAAAGKYTAAICAAPMVLAEAGVLERQAGHQLPRFSRRVAWRHRQRGGRGAGRQGIDLARARHGDGFRAGAGGGAGGRRKTPAGRSRAGQGVACRVFVFLVPFGYLCPLGTRALWVSLNE